MIILYLESVIGERTVTLKLENACGGCCTSLEGTKWGGGGGGEIDCQRAVWFHMIMKIAKIISLESAKLNWFPFISENRYVVLLRFEHKIFLFIFKHNISFVVHIGEEGV